MGGTTFLNKSVISDVAAVDKIFLNKFVIIAVAEVDKIFLNRFLSECFYFDLTFLFW